MWLFTTIGFFSIVQKPDQDYLTVRARVASDLDRLRQRYLPELSNTEPEVVDYPFKANISREALARGMERIIQDITYSDFQTEVVRSMGFEREHVYTEIWDVLHELEQIEH
jgi:hypothetical protein